jgi:quercetin dioxygenase-like cupin family protein
MNDHAKTFETGKVIQQQKEVNITQMEWNAHPTCQGVSLKHLVTGDSTNGKLSCHLVRVKAGCEISHHTHPGNLELHEVLKGDGVTMLAGRKIAYRPGTVVVIPANESHCVIAGDTDMYLLAKFTPALL